MTLKQILTLKIFFNPQTNFNLQNFLLAKIIFFVPTFELFENFLRKPVILRFEEEINQEILTKIQIYLDIL